MSERAGKLYIRETTGRYARLRWLSVWLTQIVFFGLPWLTLHGRPLFALDLEAQRAYLFGIVLWPQEFIYLAAFLILVLGLQMLSTTVVGRVWCGFACPHTIYTELFLWLERKIEGSRGARIRLDQQRWSARKLGLKAAKHGAWLALAGWTGISFVAYFTPMRALLHELAGGAAPAWKYIWIALYGGLTYAGAGVLREQMCRVICPHGRLQSTLFDAATLVVTYDAVRGEPRGLRNRKTAALHASMGDCVDCTLCVQVCPTGSDIRHGMHSACMGCGACIDACDGVMDKLGAPRGLIRFATLHPVAALPPAAPPPTLSESVLSESTLPMPAPMALAGFPLRALWLRPRVLIYAAALAALVGAVGAGLATRVPLLLDVLADRLPQRAEEGYEDGREDGGQGGNPARSYRLAVSNTDEAAHRYRISVRGAAGLAVVTPATFALAGGAVRQIPLRVQLAHAQASPGSHAFEVVVQALDMPNWQRSAPAVFVVARPIE